MAAAGVIDVTFMEISSPQEFATCVTEFVNAPSSPSKGSPSKTKKRSDFKALRLGNNNIRDFEIFTVSLPQSVDFSRIMWLDLSFNQLSAIDDKISTYFPSLVTLYLHANNISRLSDIRKLAVYKDLRSLTLYGNPVEEKKHYRNLVLYTLPNLTQLDFCVITAGQRDQMIAWSQFFRKFLNPDDYE